ncbi:hypothetical protein LJR219_004756 [Phenylobacterium sp. LjRoot219]|uniref:hypothetical protein n=1 Tax=Phenylobacterium sp. LjRoot219 TaxID=3342283 RepID=UPI003ECCE0E0
MAAAFQRRRESLKRLRSVSSTSSLVLHHVWSQIQSDDDQALWTRLRLRAK